MYILISRRVSPWEFCTIGVMVGEHILPFFDFLRVSMAIVFGHWQSTPFGLNQRQWSLFFVIDTIEKPF